MENQEIRFSERTIEYHRQALTLPPTIIRQCDSVRNHGAAEGVWA